MRSRRSIRAITVTVTFTVAALAMMPAARAFDETKYPDLRGQWRRMPVPGITGQPGYDPTKRQGLAQQAPLTAEAQAILAASLADQKQGGQGNDPTYNCMSPGMPRIMMI